MIAVSFVLSIIDTETKLLGVSHTSSQTLYLSIASARRATWIDLSEMYSRSTNLNST